MAIAASGTIISSPKPSATEPSNINASADHKRGPANCRKSLSRAAMPLPSARLIASAGARASLALARFEATVGFVDDVSAPTTADHTAVPVARLQRLE